MDEPEQAPEGGAPDGGATGPDAESAGPRPPFVAGALVRRLLPRELRDPVAGDLAEEYVRRARSLGPLHARLWYWGQVARLRPLRLRHRLARLDGAWLPGGRRPTHTPGFDVMEAVTQTLRHTVRRLLKTPGFTLVAILSLALGIGANTAVFSLANAIFLQDAGIRQPERVVQIYRNASNPYWSITWEHYRTMRDEVRPFTDVTAYRMVTTRVGESDDLVPTLLVSGDYFGVMGVQPDRGRGFAAGRETDVEDGPAVAVLSHDYWSRAFGADPDVLGREIRVNARPTTVVGILPPDFTGLALGVDIDLFLPDPGAVANAGSDFLIGAARTQPGTSPGQVRGELAAVAASFNETRPESLRPIDFTVVPQTEIAVHPFLDQAMTPMAALLFAVVALVLLIACTNLASFLLARASDRRKEFAVRMAMGAGRKRVAAQLLSESLILAMVGGAAGVGVAYAGLRALLRVQPPGIGVSVNLDVSPDWRVLLFTMLVATVAGLLFGLLPALRAGRDEIASVLRDEGGKATGTRRRLNLRGLLVSAQVAMSLVLLAGGGLFIRSLLRTAAVDPGFEPEGVALVTVDPETTGYDSDGWWPLYQEVLREVRELPGVEAAAVGTRIPLQLGNARSGIQRTDVEPVPGREYVWPQVVMVGPGYFETLGMELVRGRGFTDRDGAETEPVVVLSETAVATLWEPGAEVVGRPLRLSWTEEQGRIVGVAADVKLKSLDEQTEPVLYLAMPQQPRGAALVTARGPSAATLAPALRRAAKSVDPDLFVHSAMTARESMSTALFLPRMGALLLGVFGALALSMAAIGLYGVVSYTVARREREVGIRISLGAERDQVVALMMKGGMALVLAGVVLGMAGALVAGRLVERFLLGVSGTDPVTLVGVPLFLMGVALVAAWLPARRAARVDPMETLRSE